MINWHVETRKISDEFIRFIEDVSVTSISKKNKYILDYLKHNGGKRNI